MSMSEWLRCAGRRALVAAVGSAPSRRASTGMMVPCLIAAAASAFASMPVNADDACPKILDRSFRSLQRGDEHSLCDYAGKVLLVVNTASFCGYTDQYEGLEALQRRYGERGLVVLGFPSNDFGRQEPGSDDEIAEFCRTTYGVRFPMFSKSRVVGDGANALFVDLARLSGEQPRWNFHKYLIGRRGNTVRSFASAVAPADSGLVSVLEDLLAQRP